MRETEIQIGEADPRIDAAISIAKAALWALAACIYVKLALEELDHA